GHNEMDEPSITNPLPYHNIRKHDPVDILYGNQLVEDDIISEDQMNNIFDEVQKELRAAHDKIDKNDKMDNPDMQKPDSLAEPLESVGIDISYEQLKEINDAMLSYPQTSMYLRSQNKV